MLEESVTVCFEKRAFSTCLLLFLHAWLIMSLNVAFLGGRRCNTFAGAALHRLHRAHTYSTRSSAASEPTPSFTIMQFSPFTYHMSGFFPGSGVVAWARQLLDNEREGPIVEKAADRRTMMMIPGVSVLYRITSHHTYLLLLYHTWCRVSASEILLRHASCSALKPDAALDSTAAR